MHIGRVMLHCLSYNETLHAGFPPCAFALTGRIFIVMLVAQGEWIIYNLPEEAAEVLDVDPAIKFKAKRAALRREHQRLTGQSECASYCCRCCCDHFCFLISLASLW